MTRAELVKFLEDTYEPDEELVWQTMCFGDVEGVEGATEELWSKFIEHQVYSQRLDLDFYEATGYCFADFVEKTKEED